MMVLFFVISPALTEAKNDENKREEREQRKEIKFEAKEEKDFSKCFKAWGHLIAPGWIKLNTPLTVPEGCIMPFGIGKKFGNQASTTPDTIAPIISNLTINPKQKEAKIRWETNEPSNSVAYLSTTSPVNVISSTTVVVSDNDKDKKHELSFKRLTPNTTYFVFVTSKDRSGNVATSSTTSFSTLPQSLDTKAPTISSVIATTGTTTVNVGWKTNEPSTTKVYYSTTSPVNLLSANFLENNSLVSNHLISISGLSTSTTYYLVLESKDSSGNIKRTDQFSATTASGL